MRAKRAFQANLVDGRLKPRDPVSFNAHIWRFKPEDELIITVEKRRKKRSLKQNNYYFGVVLPVIAKETGHSEEELHEIYKRMFLPRRVLKYKDKDFPIPGSTTETDTMEFMDYVERVRAEAATFGIKIPSPNEIEF